MVCSHVAAKPPPAVKQANAPKPPPAPWRIQGPRPPAGPPPAEMLVGKMGAYVDEELVAAAKSPSPAADVVDVDDAEGWLAFEAKEQESKEELVEVKQEEGMALPVDVGESPPVKKRKKKWRPATIDPYS